MMRAGFLDSGGGGEKKKKKQGNGSNGSWLDPAAMDSNFPSLSENQGGGGEKMKKTN